MSDNAATKIGRLREVPSYPGIKAHPSGLIFLKTESGLRRLKPFKERLGRIPRCNHLRMIEDFVSVPDLKGNMVDVSVRKVLHEVFRSKEIEDKFYRYARIKNFYDPPRRSTGMKPGLERDVKRIMEKYSNVL